MNQSSFLYDKHCLPNTWAFDWRQDPLSDQHTALKNPCSLILKTMLESFYPVDCGITMFHNFIFMLFNKKTYKIKELWVLDFEYNTISSQMKDICALLISKNCSQLKIGLLVQTIYKKNLVNCCPFKAEMRTRLKREHVLKVIVVEGHVVH